MTRTRIFVRDDGETELEVDYEIRGGSAPSGLFGLPEDYDPGEPPEITITDAWLLADANDPKAPRVTLTDAEAERFDDEVLSDPATNEPEEPDYD
ncbi:MAG: hypothetical protein Tp170SUR191951_45 [Prokaryotic dsDNA virus sp.]|nr:hypothetical protein [Pseudomonas sp.]MBS67343.1 hypothetical protein [Pseudomonas sp.]QDP55207.1 MAG: hypothetical protein Tp170SUR191951_45 [Prokaryotic dsDNA virus sp.]|tara:strand:- start:2910 stop:3194 length:285 start_codon:yes stop_codon:yes gene_type:complete